MPLCRSIAFAALLCAFAVTGVYAQVTGLLEVAEDAPEPDRSALLAERVNLKERLAGLQERAGSFNARCAGVDVGSAAEAECVTEYAELNGLKAAYNADAEAFNARVRELAKKVAAGPAGAPFTVGVVLSGNDTYLLMPDGRKISSSGEAVISLGTKIVTGKNGRVQAILPDETVFTVGPDTELIIDEFVYDPFTGGGKLTAELVKGVFRYVTAWAKRLSLTERKLVTPGAVVGIRGTDVECAAYPDGSGYIKLFSGEAAVTPAKGGETITLLAGQIIEVGRDGRIIGPRPIEQ